MGDCCYMKIFCRRQDMQPFEDIGFGECGDDAESPVVEMDQEEANYACHGHLPQDIPWHGSHCAGGDYGAAELYCNGRTLWEWPTDIDHSGGYIFPVHHHTGAIMPEALANWEKFWAHKGEVIAYFSSAEVNARPVTA